MSKKALVIYHAKCVDGFSAAYAAWLGLQGQGFERSDLTFVPGFYGYEHVVEEKAGDFAKYNKIFIVDFSVSAELLKKMEACDGEVMVIDHHLTAYNKYAPEDKDKEFDTYSETRGENVFIVLNNNHCGAMLTWGHFFPETVIPALFKYVDDYDRWQFQFDETKPINKYIRTLPMEFEVWDKLVKDLDTGGFEEILKQGQAIQKYHDMIVDDIVGNAREVKLKGVQGLSVNCNIHFSSDVGNKLAEQSGTFGATFVLNKHRQEVYSLRSIGDSCNVSELAEKFGGGGHKNAAGFKRN